MSVDTKMSLRTSLCLANPSRMQAARWMRPDTKQALRPVLSLPNPSAMQGARWGEASVDTKQALRLVLSLTNPSELRAEEVPLGQGARWISRHGQSLALTCISDRKCHGRLVIKGVSIPMNVGNSAFEHLHLMQTPARYCDESRLASGLSNLARPVAITLVATTSASDVALT